MTFLRRRSETENEEKIWRRKIFFSPRRREMEKEKEDDILSRKIILFWRRRTEKEKEEKSVGEAKSHEGRTHTPTDL